MTIVLLNLAILKMGMLYMAVQSPSRGLAESRESPAP